ncbi:hypothetical protein [Enterococcus gallinarum]|uniref:hypothetical protein n=1 Tax=Enterococcus gallinarum TaxID=1353 RepID=UPI003D6C487A
MKKSELEQLVLNNIQKANKELFNENYWDEIFARNLEMMGTDNPNVVHNTYQATTLRIMSKALVDTLIDLNVIEIDRKP